MSMAKMQEKMQKAWKTEPFGHAVVKDLWPNMLLACARDEISRIHPSRWQHFRNGLELKDAADFRGIPDLKAIQKMRKELERLAPALSELTGIPNLKYSPLGGGVHSIPTGGKLGVHRDFNQDEEGLWRRVNVLVYLQSKWDDRWGGHLQLHRHPRELPEVTVRPEFNTTAIFVCGENSWHGHPIPHTAPVPRLSLAAYYFTREAPGEDLEPHSTVFA